jgi:hypothetical protein
MSPLAALAFLLSGRIAVVASSGVAEGQAVLRYADRDSDRVAEVLRELGDFPPASVRLVRQASPASLRAELERADLLAGDDPDSEIVVYYSGHADQNGLLLGAEHFSYAELRARLAASKARVRVAVLDACQAGGAVIPKGGRPGSGFRVDAVEVGGVRGAAILAASTAGELAQESSEIGGSYFTHHLISALRGAGDRDGDGTVTLNEAYHYTYDRTVAATLPSVWGPQHPSYEWRLSGTGDLVLTRPARGRQILRLPPATAGIYVLLDRNDQVVAEVNARAGQVTALSLPAGRYRLALREKGRMFAGEVSLPAGATVAVARAELREVAPELATTKGWRPAPQNDLYLDLALAGRGLGQMGTTPELGLGWLVRWRGWRLGPRFSYGATTSDDARFSYRLDRWTVGAELLRPIALHAIELHLGGAVAGTLIEEQVRAPAREQHRAASVSLLPSFALQVPVWRAVGVRLAWQGGVELLRLEGRLTPRAQLRSSLGVAFSF